MSEVQLVAGVLEQIRQPLPAVGSLERHMRPVRVAETLKERLSLVDDPAPKLDLPLLGDRS